MRQKLAAILVVFVAVATFRLEVDGVDQGKGKLQNTSLGPQSLSRLWLYNFEDGLPAGTHVFTGHWSLPCSVAVDSGLAPGPCDLPNEPTEIITIPLTVTFT